MAGGMSPGRGVPLRDRPVATWPPPDPDQLDQAEGQQDEAGGPADPRVATRRTDEIPGPLQHPTSGRRHCWVIGPDGDRGPHPGLILAWRRGPDRLWEALVIYVNETGDSMRTTQEWVPADRLAPA